MPTVTGAGRCGNTRPVSACAVGDGAAGPGLRWAGRAPPGLASHRLLFPRRILLNYAVFNPAIGYSQGMSDLVAPLLAEILDESDTFWCFVGLMQNTIFFSSPRDEDMEKQLVRPDAEPRGAGGSCSPAHQSRERHRAAAWDSSTNHTPRPPNTWGIKLILGDLGPPEAL